MKLNKVCVQVVWAGVLWLQRAGEQQPELDGEHDVRGHGAADTRGRVLLHLHQEGDCGK